MHPPVGSLCSGGQSRGVPSAGGRALLAVRERTFLSRLASGPLPGKNCMAWQHALAMPACRGAMPPGLHRTTSSKPHGACSREVRAGRSKDTDKTMNVVARRPGSKAGDQPVNPRGSPVNLSRTGRLLDIPGMCWRGFGPANQSPGADERSPYRVCLPPNDGSLSRPPRQGHWQAAHVSRYSQ